MYEYIIIGSGITGSCIAHFLSQKTDSILILDKKDKEDTNASMSAGGFLSPLLGKPNPFKSFVNKAFSYSTNFYKDNFSSLYDECGVLRLPKDDIDREKFKVYEKYIDIKYIKKEGGFFFKDGGIINTSKILDELTRSIKLKFNYEVKELKYEENYWHINNHLKAKNIILASGYEKFLNEDYLKIKGIFGERFDISSNTVLEYNYHKECSVSRSKKGIISIGATHRRDVFECENKAFEQLLTKAKGIVDFEVGEIVSHFSGIRSCSNDYFPLLGKVVQNKKTLSLFPHLVNGTHVNKDRFVYYPSLYIINGVGGRGYVEAPYLASLLVDFIYNDVDIDKKLTPNRMFIKHIRK